MEFPILANLSKVKWFNCILFLIFKILFILEYFNLACLLFPVHIVLTKLGKLACYFQKPVYSVFSELNQF